MQNCSTLDIQHIMRIFCRQLSQMICPSLCETQKWLTAKAIQNKELSIRCHQNLYLQCGNVVKRHKLKTWHKGPKPLVTAGIGGGGDGCHGAAPEVTLYQNKKIKKEALTCLWDCTHFRSHEILFETRYLLDKALRWPFWCLTIQNACGHVSVENTVLLALLKV